jgi:hypothetical protein
VGGVRLPWKRLASTAVAHSDTLLVALRGGGSGEGSGGDESLDEERGDEHGCYARAMRRGVETEGLWLSSRDTLG